eukprot:1217558-Pyramimonas_sp.AAC.1
MSPEEVSGGSPRPMGPAVHVGNQGVSSATCSRLPHVMLVIRAGHLQPVIVVTFGLPRPELGGSIQREPRL